MIPPASPTFPAPSAAGPRGPAPAGARRRGSASHLVARRILGLAPGLAVLGLLWAAPARAEAAGTPTAPASGLDAGTTPGTTPDIASNITWRMPTEYPATAMPGEAIRLFAAALAKGEGASRDGGGLAIAPRYEAGREASGPALVAALRAGTVEAGDTFAGTLVEVDPLFALSSLPFLTDSLADARRLAGSARGAYEAALDARGLHLLYLVPWPASGIWSKTALGGAGDLAGLTIRTYDAASSAVMNRAGARAEEVGFADAMPRLRAGTFNAVLSSGDGGAGRRLWEVLTHFSAVSYAFPLSFGLVESGRYAALPPALRARVDAAAAETQARLWELAETRAGANLARMRENGVAVDLAPPIDLVAALRAAARPEVEAWRARVPRGAALLDAYAAGR